LMWPVRFTATTYAMRVSVNGFAETLTIPSTGTLTAGRNYWLSGDGQADADGGVGGVGDLLTIIATALTAHTQLGTFTVSLSTTFKVTVAISAGSFQMLLADGATTFDESILGFNNVTTPSVSLASTTSPNVPHGIFRPRRFISQDSRNRQPKIVGIAEALSGDYRVGELTDPKKTREFSFECLPPQYALTEYAASDEPTNTFEYAWVNAIGKGRPFRLYEDESTRTSTSYTLYRMREFTDPLVLRDKKNLYFHDANLRVRRV
jgi:hypothetical protein